MLYAFDPLGFVAMLMAAAISILVFFGGSGRFKPYSRSSPSPRAGAAGVSDRHQGQELPAPFDDGIDLPMFDEHGNPSGETLHCHVSGMAFERPDMIASNVTGPNGEKLYISSLSLSTDKKTGDHVLPAQP